jgi:hypothetical protein
MFYTNAGSKKEVWDNNYNDKIVKILTKEFVWVSPP